MNKLEQLKNLKQCVADMQPKIDDLERQIYDLMTIKGAVEAHVRCYQLDIQRLKEELTEEISA